MYPLYIIIFWNNKGSPFSLPFPFHENSRTPTPSLSFVSHSEAKGLPCLLFRPCYPHQFSLSWTIRFYFVIFRNIWFLSCCINLINSEQKTVSTTSYVFCNQLKFLFQSQKLPSVGSQGIYFPVYESNGYWDTQIEDTCPSVERTYKAKASRNLQTKVLGSGKFGGESAWSFFHVC